MEDLLGSSRATKDVPTWMGFTTFTIPKGAFISVKQHDKNGRKILVEAGPSLIDWKHINFLQLFEKE